MSLTKGISKTFLSCSNGYHFFADLHLRGVQQGVHVPVLPLVLIPLAFGAAEPGPDEVRSNHLPRSLEFYSGMFHSFSFIFIYFHSFSFNSVAQFILQAMA